MKPNKRISILGDGKLPIDVLEPLLNSLSARNKGGRAVVPPEIGVDVGVTRVNGKYLVVSSDPITGATERIGWHAVNVSANDVATSGIMPESLSIVSMFPSGYTPKKIMEIIHEIDSTAKELGIVVVGGHTEITPKLKRPIIVVTCFGSGNKFVTSAMAEENDSILMTKVAGIEGTSILSRLKVVHDQMSPKNVKQARDLIKDLSVIREARVASLLGRVHAMHDTTEGGLLGSLVEMSLASKLGFELDDKAIPIDLNTKEICRLLHLDPLKLIGSGSLIIACSRDDEAKVQRAVNEAGVKCTKIGRFIAEKQGRRLRHKDNTVTFVTDVSIQDELWRALRKYGNLS